MKKILIILFTMLSYTGWSQQVQWAYKVLEYSSQKSSKEYAAIQVLGIPNSSREGLEDFRAWETKGTQKEEYIKVGFLNPIKSKQLIIVQSFHPGFIKKVLIFDADGKEYETTIYTADIKKMSNKILQINLSGFDFPVFAAKIVLNCEINVPIGIDAIGITTSSTELFTMEKNPNDIIKSTMVILKLDTTVNSKFPEMGPLVSPDGKTLYFSRRGDPADMGGKKDEEDIWYSEWNEKSKRWGSAKNIGAPLNNKDPNFINSISPDGNTILLGNSYLPDGSMSDGVSISQRTRAGWSFPVRLKIEDDDRNISKMANYFQSNSQKILLLSNDRKGDSYGDRDIYVSFLKNDSTWTKPLNLGPTINTKGTEAAPFLAADNRTLYFTSDGLNGYGGSDIYMSRRLDSTWLKWSVPENLGPIVNTAYDESYLTLTASGNKVYFTSQTNNDQDVDMYTLVMPEPLKPLPVMLLLGRVINSKTNAFVPGANIYFENLSTGIDEGVATSNLNSGNFQIILPTGSNYGYRAEKEGYISVNSNIDLTNLAEYKEGHKDIFITPLELGQTIVLNNIFFDFDKSELRRESFPELKRLVDYLLKNPSMRIEVSGSTDNVGTVKYNDALSIRRAEAVVTYLLGNSKIDKSRILMKHTGELKPATSNNTEKGRQLNRKVSFKIIKK